jgi:small GTP-binding protein
MFKSSIDGSEFSEFTHITDTFNVALIGDSGVGKTTLIKRFLYSKFSTNHETTIEDFYQTPIKAKDNNIYILDIIDTAGLDEFKSVFLTSVKSRDGYIFVYDFNDVTSLQTFDKFISGI